MSNKNVNFLPPEAQVKRKQTVAANDAIAYVQPTAANDAPTADSSSAHAAQGRPLAHHNPVGKDVNVSAASQAVDYTAAQQARDVLLRQLKTQRTPKASATRRTPKAAVLAPAAPVKRDVEKSEQQPHAAAALQTPLPDPKAAPNMKSAAMAWVKKMWVHMPFKNGISKTKGAGVFSAKHTMDASSLSTNLVRGYGNRQYSIRTLVSMQVASFVVGLLVIVGANITFQQLVDSAIIVNTASDGRLLAKSRELANLRSTVDTNNELRGLVLQVNDLLAQHPYWTQFFSYLEEYTLPGVYYEGFGGSTDGEYVLNARADNFDTFVQQMALWQTSTPFTRSVFFNGAALSSAVNSTTATSTTVGADNSFVSFTVRLSLDPSLFTFQDR